MYLKDMDDLLSKFVGEWTAKYEKNQVTLNIEKIEKHPVKIENVNHYIMARYRIKIKLKLGKEDSLDLLIQRLS